MRPKDIEVAMFLAQGKSMGKTAKEVGMSKGNVHYLSKKPEIKQFIIEMNHRLINDNVQTMVDRIALEQQIALEIVKYQAGISPNRTKIQDIDQHQFLFRADRVSTEILKSVGLYTSHTMSYHNTTIINDNRKAVISPIVTQLLQGKVEELTAIDHDDPVDAEYEEVAP
jgi:phage terminase small subunit